MRRLLAASAATALLATGCGGGDDDAGGGGPSADSDGSNAPQRVEMSEFAFSPEEIRIERGDGLLAINVGSTPHNLTIERDGGREFAATDDVATGAMERLPVDVQPGEYTLVCTVPGHRERGMVGRIAVE